MTGAETFDYIIVGGGNAGCVLANRLTASEKHSVLLLEAGSGRQSFWVPIPAGFSKLLSTTTHNWLMRSEPEEATKNRRIPIPLGKGLGGSTLINGMIYVRGQPQDYDGWAQRGCPGWAFDDVLVYFKKIEDYDGKAGDLRAKDGPLPITTVKERPELAEAFISAGEAAGLPRNPDYNADSQDGVGYYQVNQKNGRRVSAKDAYLEPARGRSKLRIVTNARVTRVELDQGRATGVTVRTEDGEVRYTARAEVVLCAGAIHTPHLLELSGIGDPEVLKRAGVGIRHPLPGVGRNYLDHYCTRMNWRVSQPITLNEQSRRLGLVKAVAEYFTRRTGILTLGTGLAHGFLRTRDGLDGPDIQLFFIHASYGNAAERKLDTQPGMTVGVTQLRPQSSGCIHLRSPDPHDQPAIRPNFLDAEEDRRCMVEGMKMTRDLIDRKPLDPYREEELNPGADCRSDHDWLEFARRNGQTIYHACGTCRMGGDEAAVVDPKLRVRGIVGLRIADASVMPTIVSGNTQAAVYMIAEKASDLIMTDA